MSSTLENMDHQIAGSPITSNNNGVNNNDVVVTPTDRDENNNNEAPLSLGDVGRLQTQQQELAESALKQLNNPDNLPTRVVEGDINPTASAIALMADNDDGLVLPYSIARTEVVPYDQTPGVSLLNEPRSILHPISTNPEGTQHFTLMATERELGNSKAAIGVGVGDLNGILLEGGSPRDAPANAPGLLSSASHKALVSGIQPSGGSRGGATSPLLQSYMTGYNGSSGTLSQGKSKEEEERKAGHTTREDRRGRDDEETFNEPRSPSESFPGSSRASSRSRGGDGRRRRKSWDDRRRRGSRRADDEFRGGRRDDRHSRRYYDDDRDERGGGGAARLSFIDDRRGRGSQRYDDDRKDRRRNSKYYDGDDSDRDDRRQHGGRHSTRHNNNNNFVEGGRQSRHHDSRGSSRYDDDEENYSRGSRRFRDEDRYERKGRPRSPPRRRYDDEDDGRKSKRQRMEDGPNSRRSRVVDRSGDSGRKSGHDQQQGRKSTRPDNKALDAELDAFLGSK